MHSAPTAQQDALTVLVPIQPTQPQMLAAQLAPLTTALQIILAVNVCQDNILLEEHKHVLVAPPTAAPALTPTQLTQQLPILLVLLALPGLALLMDHACNAQQVNILPLEEHHSVQVVHQDAQLAKVLIPQQIPQQMSLVLLVLLIISLQMDHVIHAQLDNSLQEVIKLNASTVQQDAQIVQEQILQLPIVQLALHAPLITSIMPMDHALNAKRVQHPLVEWLLIVAHAQQTVPLAPTILLLLA